ncbi:hypothetical protein KJ695_05240 [Patescibacteria group bacterium]|nr:hypothetical protein [Patescibacteria group bacterium]
MDKYKESIGEVETEPVETGTVPRPEGLSPREVEVEKVEQEVKQEVKQEVIEEAKPTPPAEDKAKRGKKVEEISKLGVQDQVEALRNLALEEGPDFAVGVAKELDNAFVLDEFHDTLDKLELIKEGKLKEI